MLPRGRLQGEAAGGRVVEAGLLVERQPDGLRLREVLDGRIAMFAAQT